MEANTLRLKHNPWFALGGYAVAGTVLLVGWAMRDQRLIAAQEGVGYVLGIAGSSMMLLLLLYPLRKRLRLLRNAGPVRHWFRAHMILGVVGPVLVLFHSNFSLGSVNSRVALFCTIVVAVSGIFGRYLYSKIHDGLYGQRLTLSQLRKEIEGSRETRTGIAAILDAINEQLAPMEDAVSRKSPGMYKAFSDAVSISVRALWMKPGIKRSLRQQISRLAAESPVVAADEKRLTVNTFNYLNRRLSILLRFAQLNVCERLFSWWHVVHYPLFMVLVIAAVVHVVAVHMY